MRHNDNYVSWLWINCFYFEESCCDLLLSHDEVLKGVAVAVLRVGGCGRSGVPAYGVWNRVEARQPAPAGGGLAGDRPAVSD